MIKAMIYIREIRFVTGSKSIKFFKEKVSIFKNNRIDQIIIDKRVKFWKRINGMNNKIFIKDISSPIKNNRISIRRFNKKINMRFNIIWQRKKKNS